MEQLHYGFEIRQSVWYSSTFISISLPHGPHVLGGKMQKKKEKWHGDGVERERIERTIFCVISGIVSNFLQLHQSWIWWHGE